MRYPAPTMGAMSYSLSVTPESRDAAVDEIAKAVESYEATSGVTLTDEAREHLQVASEVAARMIEVVGSGDDANVVVSIGGHANIGHAKADGYADETMSVHVSVTRASTPTA